MTNRIVVLATGFGLLAWTASGTPKKKDRDKHATVTGQQAKEYQIKAAFLFNFTKFVEWRGSPPKGEDLPTICVSGPAGRVQVVIDTLKPQKGLSLRRIQQLDDPKGCTVLFQTSGDKPVRESWTELAKAGILVVTEDPQQILKGSILGFFLTDSKVRIEANIEAAKASGFHLNSQLLQLARIIKPDGGKE